MIESGAERQFLQGLFEAAVAAAEPSEAVRRNLPDRPKGKTVVVGAGKAVVPMLAAVEKAWEGPLSGAVVTTHGTVAEGHSVEILRASHPRPDDRGLAASARLMELVSGLTEDDLVISLISGGGSSLLPAPPPAFSLEDEFTLGDTLLRSGAPISAMNVIRKHFSTIKGGRLAAATKARVHTLVVSDIPGDIAHLVASGPTLPDADRLDEALAAISAHKIQLPLHILDWIKDPRSAAPHPDDAVFAGHTRAIIASANLSLEAAAETARRDGVAVEVLSDAIEGEAAKVGTDHAEITRRHREAKGHGGAPTILLSGGETTVTMRGSGKGGRNTEFLLAWAIAMDGVEGVHALAADTDGRDGSESNAGAFANGTTAQRLRAIGLDAKTFLANNDSYSAFEALDDLVITGPTGTNVNDFRAILIS